jgi:hypothetical protein
MLLLFSSAMLCGAEQRVLPPSVAISADDYGNSTVVRCPLASESSCCVLQADAFLAGRYLAAEAFCGVVEPLQHARGYAVECVSFTWVPAACLCCRVGVLFTIVAPVARPSPSHSGAGLPAVLAWPA